MQVEVDVKYMETNSGGHDISGFGEIVPFSNTFKTAKISHQTMDWSMVHGGQKIELAQKIHASRGGCEMHGNQFWWAWHLWFLRFCSFFKHLQNGQNFPSDHGL